MSIARQIDRLSTHGKISNLADTDGKGFVYCYKTNVSGFCPKEGRVSRVKTSHFYVYSSNISINDRLRLIIFLFQNSNRSNQCQPVVNYY